MEVFRAYALKVFERQRRALTPAQGNALGDLRYNKEALKGRPNPIGIVT